MIWVKIRQRQAFPQTFFEALNPIIINTPNGVVTIQPLQSYVKYLNKYGITAGNAANPQPYESAICLLMALRRNISGGGEMSEDTFGVGTFVILKTDPANANMQPTPCLVDGWKQPLLFARWPTGFAGLTSKPANDPADPSDPQKLLAGLTGTNLTAFQNSLHVVWSNQTSQLMPLIASCGPDNKPGLAPRPSAGTTNCWKTDGSNDATDNIYSNNLP